MKLVVLVVLVVSACNQGGPTQEEMMASSKAAQEANRVPARAEIQPILDKHAGMVKAKRAAALAVAADAKAAPAVTAPEPLATPLRVPPGIPGDTLFASPERVADPSAAMPFGFDTSPFLAPYEDMLAPGSTTRMKADELEKGFAAIAERKYALMVRVREYRPSKIVLATVGGQHEQRYEAGSVSGDAIFYALDTKQRLGAFPFAFQAKGSFSAKRGEDAKAEGARLETHLRDSVKRQLEQALAEFATGKGAPSDSVGAAADTAISDLEREIRVEFLEHAVLIDTIKVTPGTVTITSMNPDGLDAKVRATIAAFASKKIGTDVVVKVIKK